ncbi:hypothetical protein LJ737_04420 [Hymenobacter sp. 15J16-1T3B]|uniref:hypothetical protein n=1 Tax=Hymenobacter sp. 15J16-1T3B TaxID=2886941 RepID=UPI001D12227A|nr:hypothetical protein [Hymenobacter sp. 15J16-1T3B]MCC3156468.1 hypothetical protein [Hymenobacter sp. 15J16-1T3B]
MLHRSTGSDRPARYSQKQAVRALLQDKLITDAERQAELPLVRTYSSHGADQARTRYASLIEIRQGRAAA